MVLSKVLVSLKLPTLLMVAVLASEIALLPLAVFPLHVVAPFRVTVRVPVIRLVPLPLIDKRGIELSSAAARVRAADPGRRAGDRDQPDPASAPPLCVSDARVESAVERQVPPEIVVLAALENAFETVRDPPDTTRFS